MRTFPILLIIFACQTGTGQKTNKEFVDDIVNKYDNHKSITYNIHYQINTFDEEKPWSVHTLVMMQKIKQDSVFGGKFLYEYKLVVNDSTLFLGKYYDTEYLYVINHNEKEIIRYNASAGETFPIYGAFDGEVIRTYFFNSEYLLKTLESEKNKITYIDTAHFARVKIEFPDDEDNYDKEKQIYINKLSKTINKITFQARYKDQIQRNQWLLSNIVFDTIQDNTLENVVKPYFEQYEIKDFEPRTEEDYKLMGFGEIAPTIEGKLFPDYSKNVKINLEKVTVLDFWYTSCIPCIKAIPHLNRLKEKYGDQIQIVGVNDIDKDPKNKQKIEAFLNRTPINYKVLLIDTIPKEYNVIVYPTLYIIGTDNRVKYNLMSYSDDLFEKLDKILSELITN